MYWTRWAFWCTYRKISTENAITHAIKLMQEIDNLIDYTKETTINLEYVKGWTPMTIIVEDCKFGFDVRFKYMEEMQRVKQSINQILTQKFIPGIKVSSREIKGDMLPLPPNINSEKFFDIVNQVAQKNNLKVFKESRGGGSDANILYKFNPKLKILDGFAPKGGVEHTKKEFVYVKSIKPLSSSRYAATMKDH